MSSKLIPRYFKDDLVGFIVFMRFYGGSFILYVLLQKKVQEDGKLMPEFADEEEGKCRFG